MENQVEEKRPWLRLSSGIKLIKPDYLDGCKKNFDRSGVDGQVSPADRRGETGEEKKKHVVLLISFKSIVATLGPRRWRKQVLRSFRGHIFSPFPVNFHFEVWLTRVFAPFRPETIKKRHFLEK